MGTGMGALIMVGYASFTEFIPRDGAWKMVRAALICW